MSGSLKINELSTIFFVLKDDAKEETDDYFLPDLESLSLLIGMQTKM